MILHVQLEELWLRLGSSSFDSWTDQSAALMKIGPSELPRRGAERARLEQHLQLPHLVHTRGWEQGSDQGEQTFR